MRKGYLFVMCMLASQVVMSGGMGSMGPALDLEKYVCYDGRVLNTYAGKVLWQARRGCFKSVLECSTYEASEYAYSPSPKELAVAMFRCRENYPFMLGEMQTH